MPAAVEVLEALGVRPNGMPFHGIRYTDGNRAVEALFPGASGRGVRRTELHAALRRQVLQQGIEVVEGTVGEVVQHGDRVHAAGRTARYLVAADGLHSSIRQRVGLSVQLPKNRARRWGLRRHFAVAPWTDLVEVHWSEHAEAYVTPVGEGEVGVAVLTRTKAPYDEQLRGFAGLRERLGDATESSAVLGAGPLWQGASHRVSGRVLLVGDAAGYVDALTGEGIAVGLASAKALVDCIASEHPERYDAQWLKVTRRYRMLTEGLLWASGKPVVRRQIVPMAARLPLLYKALVHQLAR